MADDDLLQAPGFAQTDSFGFETPEAAALRVRERMQKRRQQFFASAASQSQGRRVGQALADIFGPAARRALDTSVARKAERDRLIASGTDPDEARARAKIAVSPMFAEVRRATKIQELGHAARSIADDMIEQGVPAARAQAAAQLQMARRLEANGFANEATAMRVQASELLQAQEEREATLNNLKTRTRVAESAEVRALTELEADDDIYVKLDEDGVVIDARSVPVTALDERDRLRDELYLRTGPSLSFALDKSSLASGQPMPDGVRKEITARLDMLGGLEVLRNVDHITGIVKGPVHSLGVRLGLITDEGVLDARAVVDKMKADIQSTIDGIPSDYDAALFQLQVPDPFKAQSSGLYNARLNLLENNVRRAVELTASFYKGTNKEFTPALTDALHRLGIDFDDIDGMSADEFIAAKEAHEADMRAENELLSGQGGGAASAGESEEEARARRRRALLNREGSN